MKNFPVLVLLVLIHSTSAPAEEAAAGDVRVESLDGPIVYTPYQWKNHVFPVRRELSARQEQSFPDAWKSAFPDLERKSRNIDLLIRRIYGSENPTPAKSEEEIWQTFRRAWAWSVTHMRQDIDETMKLVETRGGHLSIEDMTLAERRLGYVPHGTCFSVTQTLATLLTRSGIPRDRFAIATAYYPPRNAGSKPSHVYLALFIDGTWRYFDPAQRYATRELPERLDRIRSVGKSHPKTEYTYPISLTFPGPSSLGDKLPMLHP